jgi:uncharacterized membrane protein
MDAAIAPALGVALCALLFAGTHVGLAAHGVRARLVARLGEGGFFGLYSLVASVTFALLVAYYAAHRFEGAAGLALAANPALRAVLVAIVVAGVALAVAGLAAYPRMPVALFGRSVGEPRGIERVSRHPFFAGTAMIGIAHALLATHLTGAVLMGGLALLAIAGARHQEAKHLRLRGRPYAEYLAVTSFVPFAAIVAGRQRLAWRELPFGALAAGVSLAFVLRAVHASIFAGGGRWVVLAAVGGGAVASLQSWRRARRRGARAAAPLPTRGGAPARAARR